jgi:hypothetical protein
LAARGARSATSEEFIGRSFSGPGVEVYGGAGHCGWTQASPGSDGVEMVEKFPQSAFDAER